MTSYEQCLVMSYQSDRWQLSIAEAQRIPSVKKCEGTALRDESRVFLGSGSRYETHTL